MSFERNLDKFWETQEVKFDHREKFVTAVAPSQYTTAEEVELSQEAI